MTLLMMASAIAGLPVVTVHGGEDIAEVRDVIYDPEAGRLVGLTLNKRGFLSGRHRDVLPAETIHAIGRDAHHRSHAVGKDRRQRLEVSGQVAHGLC